MAKKYGPADSKWYRCAGVHKHGPKQGKIKRGYTVNPKGGCPKKASTVTTARGRVRQASKAAACAPMIKKGLAYGIMKGRKACTGSAPVQDVWEQVARMAAAQQENEAERERHLPRQMDGARWRKPKRRKAKRSRR